MMTATDEEDIPILPITVKGKRTNDHHHRALHWHGSNKLIWELILLVGVCWSYGRILVVVHRQDDFHYADDDDRVLPSRRPAQDDMAVGPQTTTNTREVHFLNAPQLGGGDGFSASWLQTLDDFMGMPFDKMRSCEEVSFRAFDGPKRNPKMRMTLDWMDWSVEHMSKWWKILERDRGEDESIPYRTITAKFEKYLQEGGRLVLEEKETVLRNTLAVIAFLPYTSKRHPEQADNLTVLSLAATIESLRRAGFGRVVVGVLEDAHIPLVQHAVERIPNTTAQILQVDYAMVSQQYLNTSFMTTNMPRAAVMTLRDAFLLSRMPPAQRTANGMNGNMTAWLGDTHEPSYWKYIYLTEPDTILQTRTSALPAIQAALDQGSIVLPHRLQPIPHESDVRGMNPRKGTFLLEQDFDQVFELDPESDSCCDENAGPTHKPGKQVLPPCGDWPWFTCGFQGWGTPGDAAPREDPHARVKPYQLMRLQGGTGIVTLAASNHGRRCIPTRNDVCRPS